MTHVWSDVSRFNFEPHSNFDAKERKTASSDIKIKQSNKQYIVVACICLNLKSSSCGLWTFALSSTIQFLLFSLVLYIGVCVCIVYSCLIDIHNQNKYNIHWNSTVIRHKKTVIKKWIVDRLLTVTECIIIIMSIFLSFFFIAELQNSIGYAWLNSYNNKKKWWVIYW